jgi:hypothetical protein
MRKHEDDRKTSDLEEGRSFVVIIRKNSLVRLVLE